MEKFFRASRSVDIQAIEFCFKNYGKSLNELSYDFALDIIWTGIKDYEEKKLTDMRWQLYTSLFPYFNDENFISFDEFLVPNEKPLHSVDEILENTKKILKMQFSREVM